MRMRRSENSLEILRWKGGFSKVKTFKGKYESKIECSEGWGFQIKPSIVGGYGYFLELHINNY